MEKTKLKIENFLENKIDSPIMIIGGDVNNPFPSSGGSNTTGGNGSGEIPPVLGGQNRPTGPLEAPDTP